VSPDRRIETPVSPPSVGCDLRRLAGACSFEQNISQPRRIALLKVKRLSKYPSLVPATRVGQAQAIILDLADIENRLVAVR